MSERESEREREKRKRATDRENERHTVSKDSINVGLLGHIARNHLNREPRP